MNVKRSELIARYIDSFPVLPLTASKLMEVTNNPESSVREVVETIHSDHSLCLTILKIANSALFGRPKKIDSVKMAVVTLGFDEVCRIALTKAIINSFAKIPRQHTYFVDRYWEHSFVCGMAAKVIAQDLSIAPDIAFMGGLIHDIGKLVMFQTFADTYTPECWMGTLSSEANLSEEMRTFSFTHDMVGGQLLRKWLFPESLITAVAYHHHPTEAARDQQDFAYIIQLADILSYYCCNPNELGESDILTAMHGVQPDLQSNWKDNGVPVDVDSINRWFTWLLANHGQSSDLKESFTV